jgi:hypothetical protein
MTEVPTFTARIYCGLRRGYSDEVHGPLEVRDLVQMYVNEVSLCATVTQTDYIYKNGDERGVIVGLINYPQFPSDPQTILAHAVAIAKLMMKAFGQQKVSIETPSRTYMLTEEDLDEKAAA